MASDLQAVRLSTSDAEKGGFAFAPDVLEWAAASGSSSGRTSPRVTSTSPSWPMLTRAWRCWGLCRHRHLFHLKIYVRIPALENGARVFHRCGCHRRDVAENQNDFTYDQHL